MARKTKPQTTPSPQSELRDFTRQFFQFFGAPVEEREQAPTLWQVQLPEELAQHFGKPALSIGFQNPEGLAEIDLVAHGSRVFDRMLGYLNTRGSLTVQSLPSRFPAGEELLAAVRPVNASITNLSLRESEQRLFVFNFRITYRADDKREELYTVLLDESGSRRALMSETGNADRAIDLDALLADALPVEPGADGEAPKLPPMTQLTRLAENARKYAIYHADLRCVTHEAEILPRLYNALNRLTGYYEQQIDEVYDSHDPDGEKRRVLERDLERKIAEEIENHRLRVRIALFSYAVLQAPMASAELTLSDGQVEATVSVRRNRYNGALRRPTCHACGQETQLIALDRVGHVTCDDCLHQCAGCLSLVCASCGVKACPVCGQENCAECGQECWACGETACAKHSSACPTCGDVVCHACQTACDACHVLQCRSHLRMDAVPNAEAENQFICPTCAVRCPGCQQYSAQIDLCSASGQRFCANCLVNCAECGEHFGPGFYQNVQANGQPYCMGCLTVCPACNSQTSAVVDCAECGTVGCQSCLSQCAVCGQAFCQKHVKRHLQCGHTICTLDATHCYICELDTCTLCASVCGICEGTCCILHTRRCTRCGGVYCRNCALSNNICETCATVTADGERVDLLEEPCAVHEPVARLANRYQWLRTGNARYTIYVGRNALRRGVGVIVDRWAKDEPAIEIRSLDLLTTLRERLW
ncbi:MAG: hypothetical protein HC802_21260 [Caldilineaceae bacterium]|nr:hypothetical protein [Caldilineaceae bacterium]